MADSQSNAAAGGSAVLSGRSNGRRTRTGAAGYRPKHIVSDLLEDFFKGFVDNAKTTLHILMKYGRNEHHKIESIFKAFGKAIKMAVSKDKRMLKDIPSTKGVI